MTDEPEAPPPPADPPPKKQSGWRHPTSYLPPAQHDPAKPLPRMRNERFCQLCAAGLGVGDAYDKAGFTGGRKNGWRLRHREDIAQRIDWLIKEGIHATVEFVATQVKDVVLSRQWVLDSLMHNAKVALGVVKVPVEIDFKKRDKSGKVVVDEEGKPVMITVTLQQFERNAQAANRSLELLGQELGLFEGKGVAAGDQAPGTIRGKLSEDDVVTLLDRYRPKGDRRKRDARAKDTPVVVAKR